MNRLILLALLPLAFALALWGCDNNTDNELSGPVAKSGTCLGCHSSEEDLKAELPDAPGEPPSGGG